jgi:hypothetical protein
LEAERLLKIDVNNGKHNEMLPEVLCLTNLAYEEFPLKIFRNHIHQEVRSGKEMPYWLSKKATIKRKKEKKKKAAAGIAIGADEAKLVLE